EGQDEPPRQHEQRGCGRAVDSDAIGHGGLGQLPESGVGARRLQLLESHLGAECQVLRPLVQGQGTEVTQPTVQPLNHRPGAPAGFSEIVGLDLHCTIYSSNSTSRIFSDPSGNRTLLNWSWISRRDRLTPAPPVTSRIDLSDR